MAFEDLIPDGMKSSDEFTRYFRTIFSRACRRRAYELEIEQHNSGPSFWGQTWKNRDRRRRAMGKLFERRSSQRLDPVWEKISKTRERPHQWEVHETTVWFLAVSRMSKITKQSLDANSVKSALLCTERLTVRPPGNRKRLLVRVLLPCWRIPGN